MSAYPIPLPSGAPDGLALYRRRWTAWFSLPFGVIMGLGGVYFAVVMIGTMRGGPGMFMVAAAMLVCLGIGATLIKGALRALRTQEPALVFDANGITWHNGGTSFIPWDAVERISSNEGDGNDLGIWHKAGPAGSAPGGAGRALRRALLGADQTIPLGDLVYQPRLLASTITRLHAAAGQALPS